MKLEVKYIFPTSISGANFYIYELPEGLGMKIIDAHGTSMQKKSTNQEGHFPDFHGVMWVQSPICTPVQKFHQWYR